MPRGKSNDGSVFGGGQANMSGENRQEGRGQNSPGSTNPGNETLDRDNVTAENKPTAEPSPTVTSSPTAEVTPAPTASPTPEVSEADDVSTAAEDDASEEIVITDEADTGENVTATVAPPTPAPTEVPDPNPSSVNANVWIAIIAGLVVLAAAALLLKRFVFNRKAGGNGTDAHASQPRGRHVARSERGIEQVSATMAAGDSQVQSQYSIGCAQWIGKREDQEDALMVSDWKNANAVARRGILAAVADGIGGLDDGQVASQTLMRTFEDGFEQLDPELSPQGKLLELTAHGQREVADINRRGRRCGTTLVAVLIQNGYLSAISVGDSRIALYRSGVLLQLNREHVNARVRDEESAFDGAPPVEGRRRAALTSYIGKEDFRELDRTLNPIKLIPGDRVLLMSDGVFGTLNDDQLVALLEQDAQQAADSIINQVQKQKNQYQDNTTVVVIEVK